ncbi:MAG: FmdE family protein [Chloroflexota bacterium]
MHSLESLLAESSARHSHLCPRQVLGVRIGLAGAAALQMGVPRKDKRLLVLVECDGCFADGVEVATGATMGHRTLRLEDVGKIAATFINVKTEEAVRVAPQIDVRERAWSYAPEEKRRYFAMLSGYQRMPDDELLTIQPVQLTTPVKTIVSRPGVRVDCERCGEEIVNEREVMVEGQTLCQICAGNGYYTVVGSKQESVVGGIMG